MRRCRVHFWYVVVLPLGFLVGDYGQEALRKPKERFRDAEHIEFAGVREQAAEDGVLYK